MILPSGMKFLSLTKEAFKLLTCIKHGICLRRNLCGAVIGGRITSTSNVVSDKSFKSFVRHSSSSLATPVFTQAPQYSDRLALTDDKTSYTYGQLYLYASRIASKIGPQPGTKIAFLTPNSGDYVAVQWAIWMCGAVAVPLCKTHPTDTLRYYVENSEARLLIVTRDLQGKVGGLEVEKLMVVELEDSEGLTEYTEYSPVVGNKEDPAMILYTSGTTGPPKGVVLTHSNLENQVKCLLSAWEWNLKDSILHVLPLHHTHGIVNCLLCPLSVGARVVMMGSFDADKVWANLTSEPPNINVFMAVPTIYAKLVEHFEKKDSQLEKEIIRKRSLENIRLMVSGSAALPTPVLHQWKELTGHTLLERYGMTEIGMALSNPLHGERKPGCVGRPLPGVKVRVVRWKEGGGYDILAEGDADHVQPQDQSEEGELLVQGPNVFKEYFNKPAETAKEFTADGWFRTGDTCRLEEGVFRILGRTSVDIIKSGGYKISALDVERVLLTHPDIMDVAVVGVENVVWGQKVAAVVVLGPSVTMDVEKLKTWCQDKMAKYWIPTELRVLEEMPRNAMGKVNKKELLKNIFPK